MKITKANLTRAMNEQDLSKRKAKLQSIALGIGHHGGIWQATIDEIDRLNAAGVKTPLEKALGI